MNAGGAETFLMKIFRRIDRTKYMMDFAVAIPQKGLYDDEIEKMGGCVYHITPKSSGIFRNFKDIKTLVANRHYYSVLRVSQHSASALELLAAWLGGAKIRGFRSSNSNTTTGRKRDLLIHKVCMFMPRLFANVRIAPSTEAAEYMFGKGCIKRKKAFILKNAIDLSVYSFSEKERSRIRNEFGFADSFVVGHIGRFNQQKNHFFLISVFVEIKRIMKDAKLLLVGVGEKEDEIKKAVLENGIGDSVVFAGIRSDIPGILSAMDVFLFPSLYEGMPNTVIEAQACGLPCIVSDCITKEAKITNLVEYIPLSASAKEWAEAVVCHHIGERSDTHNELSVQKYDINESVERFVDLLFMKGPND